MEVIQHAPAAAVAPHPPLPRYYGDERQRRLFVRGIFDSTACDYDRVERAMALGTGPWYRRQALARAGLRAGMNVLDVAVGTGLVAREAVTLAGDSRLVLGVDPSAGMLAETCRQLSIRVVRAMGEQLPLRDGAFDFLSMGYAMRHLSDLSVTFREFHRVLKPGGAACLLEITRPQGKLPTALLRMYMRRLVPLISRLTARTAQSPLLWQYYWDTIEACVSPASVMAAMRDAGFVDVRRRVELGVFSEYTGRKPAAA
ncbi:MAG: demethylmenaquinone methyltransferase [Phycisphaerales bacterium]|nr:demethylmenaquinone methyltransferase [Phycisphaerales bacterium]